MASRSCDLRSSAVGDAEDDDAASLLPPADLIFRQDAKRGESNVENASLSAINSARSVENSNNGRHVIFVNKRDE